MSTVKFSSLDVEEVKEKVSQSLDESDMTYDRPPFGFQYTDDKMSFKPYLPEWLKLISIVYDRSQGKSYEIISDKYDVTTTTLTRIFNNQGKLFVKFFCFKYEYLKLEDIEPIFTDLKFEGFS